MEAQRSIAMPKNEQLSAARLLPRIIKEATEFPGSFPVPQEEEGCEG